MEVKEIVEKIRKGEIDINNQELFLSTVLKGLLIELNKDITIRNIPIPHFIVHTGSAAFYLEKKGHDFSLEPYEITNENYTYTTIPNCTVKPGGVNLDLNQLTNPYALGQLQYEDDEGLYNLTGEFRRMTIKISVDLTYKTDSFRDSMELIQQILTKLAFIRTYNITYLGQMIQCSYKIPESLESEHLAEITGNTQDNNTRNTSISLEIETNLPVYSKETIMSSDNYILYPRWRLNNEEHEIN